MLRTVLADFWAWLAAPRLIAPSPLRDGWPRWAIMVGTYLAGLIVIGTLLTAWQRALHLPGPEAFHGFAAPVLAASVVLAAPVGEEVLFRGWLTGRPRALWLLAMALVVAALLGAVTVHWHDQLASLGVIATVLAALVGWFVLRRRIEPPHWFARRFGVWFYMSVAVFGLLHLSNYPRLSWALVPMISPQVWAGLVFGYLRMRHGLWAAILAHGAGNAAALATALLAGLF
jgi:membrane protease YdiL (CAAX protease family)